MKIAHIIDWQSTTTMALFQQSFLPRMISSTTSQSQKSSPDLLQNVNGSSEGNTCLASQYQEFSRLKNPLKWAAHRNSRIRLRTSPTELISGAWARQDIFSLRHALISLVAHWSEISQDTCPIHFEDDELKNCEIGMELIEGLGNIASTQRRRTDSFGRYGSPRTLWESEGAPCAIQTDICWSWRRRIAKEVAFKSMAVSRRLKPRAPPCAYYLRPSDLREMIDYLSACV